MCIFLFVHACVTLVDKIVTMQVI